ncbi:MAG: LuxR family transcriptional regulator [Pseudomonadota bacterium]
MDEAAFRTYVQDVEASEHPGALWRSAKRFFATQGVRRLSYHHHSGSLDDPSGGVFTEGFPQSWVDDYLGEKLHRVDPIPHAALKTFEPFHWADVSRLRVLSDAEAAYMRRLDAQRLGDGLAIQVFGPDGRNGYCGLGFGGDRRELDGDQMRLLQAACQLGHLRYCRLVPPEAQDTSGLSGREREVLLWLARGKSNGAIADILGCSPHTVDTHVRRIFSKLGVRDRITAAVRAVGSGLVIP